MRKLTIGLAASIVVVAVVHTSACSDESGGVLPTGGGTATASGVGGEGGSGATGAGGTGVGGAGGSTACLGHCSNAQMDCGETYIDCGGACDPCQPVELAPTSAAGSYPRVAVARDDHVMVVWHRDSGTDSRLRWSCFGGQDWSAPAQVTPGTGFEGYPWLVVDSQERFHVVYSRGLGNGREVHYDRYDGSDCSGTWHDTAEVLPREFQYSTVYPSVGVDENDVPHVTYSQSMAPTPNPYVDCDPQGDCPADHHCYGSNPGTCIPNYEHHFSKRTSGAWGAGTWTGPQVISSDLVGSLAHHGAIFVRDSTTAHAVWLQDTWSPGGWHRIYYAQYDGSNWSTPEDTGIGAHAADVQADGQDVFVFSNNARFTSRAVGGSWASPVTVASGGTTINLIRLRLAADGRLHAVFNQQFRIMYAMTDGAGTWLPAKPVSPEVVMDTLYSNEPCIDVDGAGNAHIVWSQSDCPFNSGGHGAECEFGSVWYLKTRYDELP